MLALGGLCLKRALSNLSNTTVWSRYVAYWNEQLVEGNEMAAIDPRMYVLSGNSGCVVNAFVCGGDSLLRKSCSRCSAVGVLSNIQAISETFTDLPSLSR